MTAVITAANCVTALGFDLISTASGWRTGLSRVSGSSWRDVNRKAIDWARVDWADLYPTLITERHLGWAVRFCLEELLREVWGEPPEDEAEKPLGRTALILGLPEPERPGPDFAAMPPEDEESFATTVSEYADQVDVFRFLSGNTAFMQGLEKAVRLVAENPETICLVGGCDSLLDNRTLSWLEGSERLISESFGRQHGLIPGEGCGFVVVESEAAAARRGREVWARVAGNALEQESGHFLSDKPCAAVGYSEAVRHALDQAGWEPENLGAVFVNLNGEFFRAKEWHTTAMRCLPDDEERMEVTLHDAYGSLGAAAAAVHTCLAAHACNMGWIKRDCLVAAADDGPGRAALVLRPPVEEAAAAPQQKTWNF